MGFDPSLSSPHPAGRARAAVAANGGSGIQPRTIDFCPNFFNCFFFFHGNALHSFISTGTDLTGLARSQILLKLVRIGAVSNT